MRILVEAELEEAEWAKQRYEQLNFIDEKRLKALCHGQCYQQRMARAFNARVRHRVFNPGDLVLRKVLHVTPNSRGKFSYKYDGPFVVKEWFGTLRRKQTLFDSPGSRPASKWGSNQRILDLVDPIRSFLLPLRTYSTGYPLLKEPFLDRDTATLQRSPIPNPRHISA
ncbi:hypothetical protein CRG98_040615 [Punica granatum]|uniref:Uncharacterized protein n=1 Tax=Punica granatum TaxID=22663 RepID=A0A2I0I4S9_PUNGR|nr:hypothetical protein CRG98_040615 [Punica granatum]